MKCYCIIIKHLYNAILCPGKQLNFDQLSDRLVEKRTGHLLSYAQYKNIKSLPHTSYPWLPLDLILKNFPSSVC